MDLVQQAGQALDLVDDDPASRVEATELAGEWGRIGQQALVERLVEQIEAVRSKVRNDMMSSFTWKNDD